MVPSIYQKKHFTKTMFCCNAEDNFTRVVEMHAQNEFSHSNAQTRPNGNIKLSLCRHGGFMVRNFALIVITILEYNFFIPQTALDGETPAEADGMLIEGDGKVLILLATSTD